MVLFATLALALVATPRVVTAEDAVPSVMFVIDGSGSMWGRFETDKRAKIDVIRELLRAPIAAAGKTRIGLASFGHRRKSDCSDVEVIAEPGEAREPVLAPLEKLNPRGKGPLVAGLKAASAALGQSRPASLVVINDGADNCQQDACAFAADFAKSAPGVPIHMISIGVDVEDQPRLACISKATGGTFYPVEDTISLAAAVDAATKLAMLTPKPVSTPAADKSPPPVPAGASLRASASLSAGGPALSESLHWRIFKSGDSHSTGDGDGPDFSARLDPGTYDVEVQSGSITRRQSITIESGKPLSVTIPLNAARLSVRLKMPKDAIVTPAALIALRATDQATDPAAPGRLAYGGEMEAILPPGGYAVALTLGQIRQEKSVSLSAGSDAAVEFELGSGQLELSASLREDGPPLADVTFGISEDDPDSPDGKRDVARSRAASASFTLPAGTYYVSARSGEAEVRQRIAIGAGDSVKRTLVLPLVPVKVTAVIAGQPAGADQKLTYRVYALDGDTAKPIARSLQPALDLTLLPGKYRFAAHLDANHIKVSQDVVLEAGKHADVSLKIDAAEVSLKGPAASSGLENFWQISDSDGKPVWHTAAAEPKALLAPGRYVVKLENRDKSLEAAFEVHAGERKTLQLGQVP
jgi:Ca-activated chloride channel family protein